MRLQFYKITLLNRSGTERDVYYARLPFGLKILSADEHEVIDSEGSPFAAIGEPIADIDVEGVDSASIEVLAEAILLRGILNKPGIKGKGESVLFVLVNEALHELDKWR